MVYPGQQGTYTITRVPDAPQQQQTGAAPQQVATLAPANASPAPAPVPSMAPSTAPQDDNLNQVESAWPKLSESDKALLAQTAKRLAAQKP